jgi:hypothetical protein
MVPMPNGHASTGTAFQRHATGPGFGPLPLNPCVPPFCHFVPVCFQALFLFAIPQILPFCYPPFYPQSLPPLLPPLSSLSLLAPSLSGLPYTAF